MATEVRAKQLFVHLDNDLGHSGPSMFPQGSEEVIHIFLELTLGKHLKC